MNRMIVASKQAIRVTFSHGQMRCAPSAPISRFLCTNAPKALHSWSNRKKPWSEKHRERPSSDHLPQFKNQKRELHENKKPQKDISSDDEFEELGETVTSPPKTNVRLCQENPKKENRESKERALRAGEIAIGTNTVGVNDVNAPRLLRVRINKVDPEISVPAVHRLFSSHGDVTGLVSRDDGAIDVFFQVDGMDQARRLVNNLDKELVREVELLQPKTTVNSTCENTELHFDKLIGELRKQLELQLIYLEDLEHLHSAVSHLKSHSDPIGQ